LLDRGWSVPEISILQYESSVMRRWMDAGLTTAKTVRRAIYWGQGHLSKSSLLSRLYLESCGKALRRIPESLTKKRLANTLAATSWPSVRLAPRQVRAPNGIKFFLHPHFGEFDFEPLYREELSYERGVFELLAGKIHEYDAVVEVGANVGVYTLFFSSILAQKNPRAKIFAFEPSREAYARLRENLAANGADNVSAFNCAVGSHSGFAKFYEPKAHLTNGSFHEGFARRFTDDVEENLVVTVDGAMVRGLVDHAERILLKIDVEGAEAAVLESLAPLLDERSPDLVVEVLEDFDQSIAAVPSIRDRYRYFQITGDGSLNPVPRLQATPSCRDYFLAPVEDKTAGRRG
jgi:FkbM family methyltransferase